MLLPTIVETKSKGPTLNAASTFSNSFGEPRSLPLDSLIYWIKRTPECVGVLKRIATDILSRISFRAVDSKKPTVGRPKKGGDLNREDEAMNFWNVNNGISKFMAALIDWLATGDAYIWYSRLSDLPVKDLKEKANKVFGKLGILFSDDDMHIVNNEFKQFIDEDNSGMFALIPSSMTTIDHNDFKITAFVQKSKKNPQNMRRFNPNEVIHAKLMEIDGSVYGFSPMESSLYAIKTINAIQDYNYNYFANGAKIDRAWLISKSMSTETTDSLKEQLQQYKSVTNARSDIIIETSAEDIKTVNLNEIGEEMEFRKLAINAVGRLAFAFNMPADILSAILGVDVKGTAMGSDIEDAGYNRNIIAAQQYWEFLWNSQLFIPYFNVEMRIERTFRQDFIRKAQQMTQFVSVAEFLMKHEFPLSDEFYMDLFQIPNEYREKGEIKREVLELSPKPNQANPAKGENQKKFSDSKAVQQKPQGPNVGA